MSTQVAWMKDEMLEESIRQATLTQISFSPSEVQNVSVLGLLLILSSGGIAITSVCWLVGWFVRSFVLISP